MASKGTAFFNAIPIFSLISISSALSPWAKTQSNDLTIDAMAKPLMLKVDKTLVLKVKPDTSGDPIAKC